MLEEHSARKSGQFDAEGRRFLASNAAHSKLSKSFITIFASAIVIRRLSKIFKVRNTKVGVGLAELTDIQRAQLDIHLEEYKQLSSEIKLRVDFQQKLTNYQLLAAGVIATIGVRITQLELAQIQQSEPVRYYLLFTPIVFLVFSWTFSNNDIMIMAIARYINQQLAKKIGSLASTKDVLAFESYLQNDRRKLIKRYGVLALLGQEFALQFVMPIILLAIYLYLYHADLGELMSRKNFALRLSQSLIILVNIGLFLLTLRLRFKIWKGYQNLII